MQSHWLDCLFPQGIAVGHVYFFLEDVFPNQPGGGRWLKTPSIMWVPLNEPNRTVPHCPSLHTVSNITLCLLIYWLVVWIVCLLQKDAVWYSRGRRQLQPPARGEAGGLCLGGGPASGRLTASLRPNQGDHDALFLVLFVWFRGKNKKKPEPTWSRRELWRTPTSFFMGLKWSSKRLDARLLL